MFFFRFSLYRFQEEGPFKGPTPKARSGHRIVYYKGSIYSFGGYNPKVRIFLFPIFENYGLTLASEWWIRIEWAIRGSGSRWESGSRYKKAYGIGFKG
jgi:hypothetical protein